MRVVATKAGFYGTRRRLGAEFDVEEGETASWFHPVGSKPPPPVESRRKKRKGVSQPAKDSGADLV